MAGFLVHQGATVQCGHLGQAKPSATVPRVTVGGQETVVQTPPYTVSGCPLTPQAGGPCVTAQWTRAATRVTLNGVPAVLSDSSATCAPTGSPLTILITQTRVKGV